MRKSNKQKLLDLEMRLHEMSKTCTYKSRNLTYDEMYNIIITKAFDNISSSKEKSEAFLRECGIFDDENHLTDKYK